MPLLYYWRPDNYYRDLDYGAGYHLNQANPLLHEVNLGESLWAFTRVRNGRYVLAAELVICAKTINPPGFRYGPYRVWGDLERSRYFKVDRQPSAEQVIRKLSVTTNAHYLGQSFQGHSAVKQLTSQDHLILSGIARDLPLEPRARILPEERLEAAVLLGDPRTVQALIEDEEPGVAKKRQAYLYQEAPSRNRQLTAKLQEMYDGQCQITGWTPRDQYGHNLCHAHHIHWLSRGGAGEPGPCLTKHPRRHPSV